MKDDILNFVAEHDLSLKKPKLRDVLSDEQLEQIKYAVDNDVTWVVIAKYFKEEHGLDYHADTYRGNFQ